MVEAGRRALRKSAPGQQSPVRAEAPGGAHLSPFVKGARGARPGELTARREEAGTAGRAARAPPPAPRLFGSGRGGRGAGPLDPLAPGLLSARRFASSHPVAGPRCPTAERPARRELALRRWAVGISAVRGGMRPRIEAALPAAATALPGRAGVL